MRNQKKEKKEQTANGVRDTGNRELLTVHFAVFIFASECWLHSFFSLAVSAAHSHTREQNAGCEENKNCQSEWDGDATNGANRCTKCPIKSHQIFQSLSHFFLLFFLFPFVLAVGRCLCCVLSWVRLLTSYFSQLWSHFASFFSLSCPSLSLDSDSRNESKKFIVFAKNASCSLLSNFASLKILFSCSFSVRFRFLSFRQFAQSSFQLPLRSFFSPDHFFFFQASFVGFPFAIRCIVRFVENIFNDLW